MSRRSNKRPLARPHAQAAASTSRRASICVGLLALVFAVFAQTAHFGFVNFDDQAYVYENAVVSSGLSFSGIGWAFTHAVGANWHPLTTLVHMLDCQTFGLWAGGHHLVNVLLHAVCAVLLFLMLAEMTGAVWRAAFVAAVFAIHPLRVESVAWVSELKDPLSGIFFMLTLWAYARYTRAKGRYPIVALWLALGLMSKPMLVTTPFVLLLLDYWPLGRLQTPKELPALLREKLPLFGLSLLSCVATVIAQQGAIQPTAHISLAVRLCNALVAYAFYLGKLVWPTGLAALYPLSHEMPAPWEMLNSLLVLSALCAAAWMLRRKYPYLLMGWLWYLGMLVPVIGIIQVGFQAYADRYTYLPQIGLSIAITWLAADFAAVRREWRAPVTIAAGLIVCVLSVVAWHQTTSWRDSGTLWTHALESTSQNAIAHENLGAVLLDGKQFDQAIDQYREALRINPDAGDAHANLGNALSFEGRYAEAITELREAVRINPRYAMAHNDLGMVLYREGQAADAVGEFRDALQIDPNYAEVHNNLAGILLRSGSASEAVDQYRDAITINPRYTDAHYNLGIALIQTGHPQDAIAEFRRVLELSPGDPDAQQKLTALLVAHPDLANPAAK